MPIINLNRTLMRSIVAVSLRFLTFFCITIANAQSPVIDSLLIALTTQEGVDKVDT